MADINNSTSAISTFWNTFLQKTGRDAGQTWADCYHFDVSEKSANELLALVLDGTKKATASSIHFFENQGMPLPKPGDLNIITGWDGTPHCVIQTTNVTILPFRDMTFDICKREGEDDTLESWQQGHVRFFTAEGKTEGYEFSWDMPVVFEDFEVVYTV